MTRFERRGRNVAIAAGVIAALVILAWLFGIEPPRH